VFGDHRVNEPGVVLHALECLHEDLEVVTQLTSLYEYAGAGSPRQGQQEAHSFAAWRRSHGKLSGQPSHFTRVSAQARKGRARAVDEILCTNGVRALAPPHPAHRDLHPAPCLEGSPTY